MNWMEKLMHGTKGRKPKEAKPPKTYRPPGNNAKKAGVIVFWVVFIAIAAWVLLNMAFGDRNTQAVVEPLEPNQATSAAAAEFAKRFADEFFTWEATAEGFKEREGNLQPYLANGLDADGGLETSGQRWNASATKVDVLQIEEAGEQKAMITVEAVQELTRPSEEEDEDDEQTTVRHIFTVPVAYAAGFGVYELPSFSAAPTAHQVEREAAEGESADREDVQEIEEFMQTFFQSYVTDTPDKLAYFMTGEQVAGLNGSKELGTVDVLDVRVDGQGWIVLASVELIEPETETVFYSNYRARVTNENGRYLVESINKGAN